MITAIAHRAKSWLGTAVKYTAQYIEALKKSNEARQAAELNAVSNQPTSVPNGNAQEGKEASAGSDAALQEEKRKLCSSGEAPSDPRAEDVTRTVIGGGVFGHPPTIRYNYSLPADAAVDPSESAVQITVIGGAEIGGATGGWLGANYLGSWALAHASESGAIVGSMRVAEGLGSGALLGTGAGGVLGAVVGLLVGAANDEAHQTKCEEPQ